MSWYHMYILSANISFFRAKVSWRFADNMLNLTNNLYGGDVLDLKQPSLMYTKDGRRIRSFGEACWRLVGINPASRKISKDRAKVRRACDAAVAVGDDI